MADGSIAPAHAGLTALAIFGVVDWTSFWYTRRLPYSPGQVSCQIEDLLTHGLRRRDDAPPPFPAVYDTLTICENLAFPLHN